MYRCPCHHNWLHFILLLTMKPHQTVRRMLVHPKDKLEVRDMADVVYQIPYKDCLKIYIGETGRRFAT